MLRILGIHCRHICYGSLVVTVGTCVTGGIYCRNMSYGSLVCSVGNCATVPSYFLMAHVTFLGFHC